METLEKIRLTDAQIQTIESGGVVVLPATWDEFMTFLEETPYRAEYHQKQIIITGLAKFIHEWLVGEMIRLLGNFYQGKGYLVAGSNVGVVVPENKGYYNPDVTVTNGFPHFFNNSEAIITNPYLLVEVLSESTVAYDLDQKSVLYKRIESVCWLVFVDRFERTVHTHECTAEPNVWVHTIHDSPEKLVVVDGMTISLDQLFANLPVG